MRDKVISDMIFIEGGFNDDALDSGGATRYGVTRALARSHGYAGPMEQLPLEVAKEIYALEFWEPLRLSDVAGVAPDLAVRMFNIAVHCGKEVAGEWLQRCLNVLNRNEKDYKDIVVDGEVGPLTIQALRMFHAMRKQEGIGYLVKAMIALQGAHYITLAEIRPKDERFVNGWLRQRL